MTNFDPSKLRLLLMGHLVTKYTLKMIAPPSTIFNLESTHRWFIGVIYGVLTTTHHSSSHIIGQFISSLMGMGQQSRILPAAGNNTVFNYHTGHHIDMLIWCPHNYASLIITCHGSSYIICNGYG